MNTLSDEHPDYVRRTYVVEEKTLSGDIGLKHRMFGLKQNMWFRACFFKRCFHALVTCVIYRNVGLSEDLDAHGVQRTHKRSPLTPSYLVDGNVITVDGKVICAEYNRERGYREAHHKRHSNPDCPCADCLNKVPPRNPSNPDFSDEYVMHLHKQHEYKRNRGSSVITAPKKGSPQSTVGKAAALAKAVPSPPAAAPPAASLPPIAEEGYEVPDAPDLGAAVEAAVPAAKPAAPAPAKGKGKGPVPVMAGAANAAPPELQDVAEADRPALLAKISAGLTKRYDEFGKMDTDGCVITDVYRANLVRSGIVDEESFYDVAAESPDDCRQILASCANLRIERNHRPNPMHHVPASKLAKIFHALHATHDHKASKDEHLSSNDLNRFTKRLKELVLFVFPLYFMADDGTLGRLRRTMVAGHYEVDDLESVHCTMKDQRVNLHDPQNKAMVLKGYTSSGDPIFAPMDEAQSYVKWCRALELYYYALFFVGNAVHMCKDEGGKEIPWMSLTTLFRIWAIMKQYVIEAIPSLRVPFIKAKTHELEFRHECFNLLKQSAGQKTFDKVMEEWGWNALRNLFSYQNNGVVVQDHRDGDGRGHGGLKGGGHGNGHKGNKGNGQKGNGHKGGVQKNIQKQGNGGKGHGNGHGNGQGNGQQNRNGYVQCRGKPFWESFQGKKFCVAYNQNRPCPVPNCDQWHWCSHIDCNKGKQCRACNHKVRF